MTDKNQKAKLQKQIKTKNVLEAINAIGSGVVNTAKDESKAISEEFFRQLLGQQKKSQEKRSTNLEVGSSVKVSEVVSGQEQKNKKLQEQIYFERRIHQEEHNETQKKLQELRLRLQAIQTEAAKMIASTASLSQEVRNAVLGNVVDPSEYQINFFENIIKLISDFRKKIDSAVVWMQGQSKRSEKKNYWSQYKKKGASFLLSPDHYVQRSAG